MLDFGGYVLESGWSLAMHLTERSEKSVWGHAPPQVLSLFFLRPLAAIAFTFRP